MALQAAAVANPTSRLLWFLWHGQVLLYKELLLLFLKSAHDGVPYSGWCFGMNGWLICSKAVWVHTDTEPVVDLSDWLSNMGCWQLLDWQPYPPEARLTLLWTPTQLSHPTSTSLSRPLSSPPRILLHVGMQLHEYLRFLLSLTISLSFPYVSCRIIITVVQIHYITVTIIFCHSQVSLSSFRASSRSLPDLWNVSLFWLVWESLSSRLIYIKWRDVQTFLSSINITHV